MKQVEIAHLREWFNMTLTCLEMLKRFDEELNVYDQIL